MASIWSWKICLESYNSRPISVDLPSSTDPVVASRTSSMFLGSATGVISSRKSEVGSRKPENAPYPASRGPLPPPLRSGGQRPRGPWSGGKENSPLEIALTFAVFHRCLGGAIVGPAGTALGDPGGGNLVNDLLNGGGGRLEGAGAGHVAHGAKPHKCLEGLLPVHQVEEVALGHQHSIALEHPPLVGEVDLGEVDLFLEDVLV